MSQFELPTVAGPSSCSPSSLARQATHAPASGGFGLDRSARRWCLAYVLLLRQARQTARFTQQEHEGRKPRRRDAVTRARLDRARAEAKRRSRRRRLDGGSTTWPRVRSIGSRSRRGITVTGYKTHSLRIASRIRAQTGMQFQIGSECKRTKKETIT